MSLFTRRVVATLCRWALAALAGGALGGCATSNAAPSKEGAVAADAVPMSARVRTLLADDKRRSSPDAWKALGPGALLALHQLAADPAEMPERRSAAVSAMGLVDDLEASATLARFGTDPNQQLPLRQAAVMALARRDGPASQPALAPLLADANPDVRRAVADALSVAGGNDSKASLQARLDAEPDPGVRDEIQRALAKINN